MADLEQLARGIQQNFKLGEEAETAHYRSLGELLLEAWPQVSERDWSKWLKRHFGLNQDTAYRYMRLAMTDTENKQ
jgi:hypothetical protein